MLDIAVYTCFAVCVIGATIYRVRRREYRELAFYVGLIALLIAGRDGIYLLPAGWESAGFWTVCAGMVALGIVWSRTRRVAQR